MWVYEARATYLDGTSVRKTFPYNEDNNYSLEEDRKFDIEEWLILRHPGCDWYSVVVIEED